MTGKNFKVFGIRGSLIGDSIMALPVLNYIDKKAPGCYKYWQVARKCSQAAPLYINHPLIDQIVISDCDEGMGPRDIEIAKQCQYVFNVMPQHPEGDNWPNIRDIYHETFRMAGFSDAQYAEMTEEEKRPKLYKWFPVEIQKRKTIALWPCAGYGKENKRNPSREWYDTFTDELIKAGYTIYQFGHPRDYTFDYWWTPSYFKDYRLLSFFDQIKLSLGCDLVVGTDSGSTLIFGAYEHPTISLLTNHWPGHVNNPYAFATNSTKNYNFFAPNGASNIHVNEVINKVKELVP